MNKVCRKTQSHRFGIKDSIGSQTKPSVKYKLSLHPTNQKNHNLRNYAFRTICSPLNWQNRRGLFVSGRWGKITLNVNKVILYPCRNPKGCRIIQIEVSQTKLKTTLTIMPNLFRTLQRTSHNKLFSYLLSYVSRWGDSL